MRRCVMLCKYLFCAPCLAKLWSAWCLQVLASRSRQAKVVAREPCAQQKKLRGSCVVAPAKESTGRESCTAPAPSRSRKLGLFLVWIVGKVYVRPQHSVPQRNTVGCDGPQQLTAATTCVSKCSQSSRNGVLGRIRTPTHLLCNWYPSQQNIAGQR